MNRAGRCWVCEHPQAADIDKRIALGEKLAAIARAYPRATKQRLVRHRDLHLEERLGSATGILKDIEMGVEWAKRGLEAGFAVSGEVSPDAKWRALPGFLTQMGRYHELRAQVTGELKPAENNTNVLIQIAMPRQVAPVETRGAIETHTVKLLK